LIKGHERFRCASPVATGTGRSIVINVEDRVRECRPR
jgi:hypothetical protein